MDPTKERCHNQEIVMIKAIIWNIRFLNTQRAFPRLMNLHRQNKFFTIALMVTFQNCRHIQRYKRRLAMETTLSNCNAKIWIFLDATVHWEGMMDTKK